VVINGPRRNFTRQRAHRAHAEEEESERYRERRGYPQFAGNPVSGKARRSNSSRSRNLGNLGRKEVESVVLPGRDEHAYPREPSISKGNNVVLSPFPGSLSRRLSWGNIILAALRRVPRILPPRSLSSERIEARKLTHLRAERARASAAAG